MSATVLPSLPVVGGCVTQHVIKSYQNDGHIRGRHLLDKHQARIVATPFTLPKVEDVDFLEAMSQRNTFFHNLCTSALEEGYHQAFCEIFNLVGEARKNFASEENRRKDAIPLEEDRVKATHLKEILIHIEKWKRQGRVDKMYDEQLALATYFDEHQDFFLADHFYLCAYNTSKQIRSDGGKKEAEANQNLGKVSERKKEYKNAIELYEKFYRLSKDKPWNTSDGILLSNVGCRYLLSAHVSFAEQLYPYSEMRKDVLDHLHTAHQLAKEGSITEEVGRIGYLIGNKYDFYGDQQSALQYHTEYYNFCKQTGDDIGLGKACQALAVANKRQGNYDQAIENLKQLLKVTSSSSDIEIRQQACSDIGIVYNLMGKYEQAANYFRQSYELSLNKLPQSKLKHSSCEYGISLAHGLLTGESESISFNNKKSIESLLFWKSERLQNFSSDHVTFTMFETLKNRQEEEQKLKERRKSRSLERNELQNDWLKEG